MSFNKNIVIVGGGAAGVKACTDLEKALIKTNDTIHRIILIETKSYFYYSIAAPRASVLDIDEQIMVPYSNLFKDNTRHKVIQASAVEFEKNYIVLDRTVPEFNDSNKIPFEYAVLATGTSYAFPCKSPSTDYDSTHTALSDFRSKVKLAESILIVGAGPVGIEMAGEISEHYPSKQILLVHDKDAVMDARSALPKFRAKLTNLLSQQPNIKTYFNERVILPQPQQPYYYKDIVVETQSGKKLNADLVILALGNRPQTDWLKNTPLGSSFINSENGYIHVKNTFQVDHPELSHVYVVGDAADLKETKMSFRIQGHIPVLVENLIASISHQDATLKDYKKGPDLMAVTFGSKKGAVILPLFGGLVLGNTFSSIIKGNSLFIDQAWKSLNLTKPVTSKQNNGYSSTITITSLVLVIAILAAYTFM